MAQYNLKMKKAKKYKAGVNALCEKWLEEMKQKSIENDSPMAFTFGKALKSLKNCPISIATINELKQLDNIGTKICDMLKKKMIEHRKNGTVESASVNMHCNFDNDDSDDELDLEVGQKRPRLNQGQRVKRLPAPKPYVPKEGTAPFAILVALYENTQNHNYGNPDFMFRDELVRESQKLFNQPMESTATQHYAGWSSMGTLIKKHLVIKRSNPAKYSLTDTGIAMAISLVEAKDMDTAGPLTSSITKNINYYNNNIGYDYSDSNSHNSKKKSDSTKVPSLTSLSSTSSLNTLQSEITQENICLIPNSYEIILLVDTQERSSGTNVVLKEQKINFETRKLNIGDFMWVARCKLTRKELVLPFIIERKRIDDLDSSIIKGRFHEQKFRLMKCGINNLIYIIENFGTKHHRVCPLTALYQAGVNLIVEDSFIVKHTASHKDTMLYITLLTNMIIKIYEGKRLSNHKKVGFENLEEFDELNKASAKPTNFTVREMLMRHLVQLNGLSAEKAMAITEFYPTPKLLTEALKETGDDLLAEIFVESTNEKIGPALSKTLHQFYTSRDFH